MEKNSRQRLLFIMEQMIEYTDAEHGVSMQEILHWLEQHGIAGARKSVYEDIYALQEYGLDIIYDQEDRKYRIPNRMIDREELLLFIRAVREADFIPKAKAQEMIMHIKSFVSSYERKEQI